MNKTTKNTRPSASPQDARARAARQPGRRAAAAALGLVLAGAIGTSLAAPIALDPTLPGRYAEGTGAHASFHAIDGDWRGSSVYWNADSRSYSNTGGAGYVPIASQAWGTGLWGLADWRAVNAEGSALPVASWQGTVATISHGDLGYRSGPFGAPVWGDAAPVPLFGAGGASEDNWTSRYTGYLRITDPGDYNFGVLYDDGFFLRIWGDDGSFVEIAADFLSPRDRLGFDQDLALGTGLYRFELGAYDRLEAGVVDLAWLRDGHWQTVPTEHLVVDPVAVGAPGTALGLLAGLIGIAGFRRQS